MKSSQYSPSTVPYSATRFQLVCILHIVKIDISIFFSLFLTTKLIRLWVFGTVRYIQLSSSTVDISFMVFLVVSLFVVCSRGLSSFWGVGGGVSTSTGDEIVEYHFWVGWL